MADMKELKNRIIPPCKKCPYRQGRISTVKNPCPECKINNYSSYEMFLNMMMNGGNDKSNNGK